MVAGVLRGLANSLRDNEKSAVVPGFLRPIDTDRIAKDLDLRSAATERGRKELPETKDNTFDANEQKIVQKLQSEWAWQGDALLNNFRAYASRLLSYSIPAELLRLRLKAQNALTRLRAASGQAPADLAPLQEAYKGARDELRDFKRDNRLTRPARQPARRWTTFGLLFIFMAIESVINGGFFAKGSEYGLAGGIGIAIGISVVNVAFSFLLGLWPFRWKNRKNFFVAGAGWIISIGGVLAVLAVHAFAAHFRETSATLATNQAFIAAVERLVSAPWRISELASVYLFALGMIFTILAAWKGYSFDDPYPRYGAVTRLEVAARENYSEAHFALFDELEQIKEETVESLDEGIVRIPKFPELAANVRAERAAMIEGFRAYESSVELAGNQLLKLYRDENKLVRKTAPPVHFDEKWHLPHSFLNTAEVRTLLDDPAPGDVVASLNELRELSEAVLAEYGKLHSRYPHPSEME